MREIWGKKYMKEGWKIYKLCCSMTGSIRYVGITRQPLIRRLRGHIRGRDHNRNKSLWIKALRRKALEPTIHQLDSIWGTRKKAEVREREWIVKKLSRGHDLLNRNYVPGPVGAFAAFLIRKKGEGGLLDG